MRNLRRTVVNTPRPLLAIIPARAGSKGVPKKNYMAIAGKTLVRRAIECARECRLFDRIAVSSDSDDILVEAKTAGAQDLRRPAELATDTSNVTDTILAVLDALARENFKPEAVVLLEPTCPLRSPAMIFDAVAALETADSAFTVTVVDTKFHPAKQFRLEDASATARRVCPDWPDPAYRQSLKPTCIRNGAAYAFRTQMFLRERSVLGPNPHAVIIREPMVNIDTPEDWKLAEQMILAREQGMTM